MIDVSNARKKPKIGVNDKIEIYVYYNMILLTFIDDNYNSGFFQPLCENLAERKNENASLKSQLCSEISGQ